MYSTYYLLGDLTDGFTFASIASKIAVLGMTLTINEEFAEQYLAGARTPSPASAQLPGCPP